MLEQISKLSEDTYLVISSIPEIRYHSRCHTQGEEFDLVRAFIGQLGEWLSKTKHYKTAIFIEPQIDSGYPDIVIVTYAPKCINNWNEARAALSTSHYKMLYEISKRRKISLSRLSTLLGYEQSITHGIICNLVKAGLVDCEHRSVCKKPCKEYYHIKSIISIEAKIDKWAIAIEQALHNTRFSNESYVLMKKDKCSLAIKDRCIDLGIGVILMNGDMQCPVRAKRYPSPNSYLSFQFNEWITQIEQIGVEI